MAVQLAVRYNVFVYCDTFLVGVKYIKPLQNKLLKILSCITTSITVQLAAGRILLFRFCYGNFSDSSQFHLVEDIDIGIVSGFLVRFDGND